MPNLDCLVAPAGHPPATHAAATMRAMEADEIRVSRALREWWREGCARAGWVRTSAAFAREIWEFLRDSTPGRRRQRFGDVEFDWEHRVDTTSANVSWRSRLLGHFLSPYQPTDPALFHHLMANELMAALEVDCSKFVFVDLGSGKGRTLLMAAEYPFQKIIGVEVVPELHEIARANIAGYKSGSQMCFDLEAVCADARDYEFPHQPLVLFLFNPLPEAGLRQVMGNLGRSVAEHPRPVVVLYHNPLLEQTLAQCEWLEKTGGTHQYSAYRNRGR